MGSWTAWHRVVEGTLDAPGLKPRFIPHYRPQEEKRAEEERQMARRIALEERKILIAQRKLETIRLLSELFNRIKVSERLSQGQVQFSLQGLGLCGASSFLCADCHVSRKRCRVFIHQAGTQSARLPSLEDRQR